VCNITSDWRLTSWPALAGTNVDGNKIKTNKTRILFLGSSFLSEDPKPGEIHSFRVYSHIFYTRFECVSTFYTPFECVSAYKTETVTETSSVKDMKQCMMTTVNRIFSPRFECTHPLHSSSVVSHLLLLFRVYTSSPLVSSVVSHLLLPFRVYFNIFSTRFE
jgi:hypothetical protein